MSTHVRFDSPFGFTCTPCNAVLPVESFYLSNIERSIHRCKKCTRAQAAKSKARILAAQTAGLKPIKPDPTDREKMAKMLAVRMNRLRASPSFLYDLPMWTKRQEELLELIAKHEGVIESCISKKQRGLVLIPVIARKFVLEKVDCRWQPWNTAIVTVAEAKIIMRTDFEFPACVIERVMRLKPSVEI